MNQRVDQGKIEIGLTKAEKAQQQAALDAERNRKKGKKQKKQEVVYDEFNFDLVIIKNFGTIQINPPNEASQLDETVKKIEEKKQWYLDNGDSKLSEQIELIKKENEEEDKEYLEEVQRSNRAAAAESRDQDRRGGRGQRGGYRGGRGDGGAPRRGRGSYRNFGPRNEFDGGEDDDD